MGIKELDKIGEILSRNRRVEMGLGVLCLEVQVTWGSLLSVLFPGRVKVWLIPRAMVYLRGRGPWVFWRLGSCWPGVIRPGRLRRISAGWLRGPDTSFRQVSPGTVRAWRCRVLKERGCPWPGVTRYWRSPRQCCGALLLSALCWWGRRLVLAA